MNDADKTCKPCNGCATCENAADRCTSCPEGKYLKSDNTCVEEGGCTQNTYYLDKVNRKCLACSTAITGCTECELDDTTGKPKCTKCGDGQTNIPRTALDGTSTCVTKGYTECQGDNNELFMKEDQSACLLCGDATTGTDKDQGTANCKTCTKAGSTKPECTACQDGFYLHTDKTCQPCAPNCATCTSADMSTCNKCLPGYFLKTGSTNECVLCGDTAPGGRAGIITSTHEQELPAEHRGRTGCRSSSVHHAPSACNCAPSVCTPIAPVRTAVSESLRQCM